MGLHLRLAQCRIFGVAGNRLSFVIGSDGEAGGGGRHPAPSRGRAHGGVGGGLEAAAPRLPVQRASGVGVGGETPEW